MNKTRWDYEEEDKRRKRAQVEWDEYESEAFALESVADNIEEPDDDDSE